LRPVAFLRPVDFRAVLLRPVDLRAAGLRVVFLRPVLFLLPVVFLAANPGTSVLTGRSFCNFVSSPYVARCCERRSFFTQKRAQARIQLTIRQHLCRVIKLLRAQT
jgi:hypothetical protein